MFMLFDARCEKCHNPFKAEADSGSVPGGLGRYARAPPVLHDRYRLGRARSRHRGHKWVGDPGDGGHRHRRRHPGPPDLTGVGKIVSGQRNCLGLREQQVLTTAVFAWGAAMSVYAFDRPATQTTRR